MSRPARPGALSRWAAVLSGALCLVLAAVYLARPPNTDPITAWPFWFWGTGGSVLLVPALLRRWRPALGPVLLWAFATLAVAEEPPAMVRLAIPRFCGTVLSRPGEAPLSVVSLNCGGGRLEAAAEALARDADVVLLQEAPGRQELGRLVAARRGLSLVAGRDCAIIVRGTQRAIGAGRSRPLYLTASLARPRRAPGRELLVVSVHLLQPVLRWDFWSPKTWREATEVNAVRVAQMDGVATLVATHPEAHAVLVGGDFNTPGGDALYRALQPRLHDAFRQAGAGWPNTIVNDVPMSRIDQLWLSEALRATWLRVHRTQNSDHRMVMAEVAVGGFGADVRRAHAAPRSRREQ